MIMLFSQTAQDLYALSGLTPAPLQALTVRVGLARPNLGRGRPWSVTLPQRVLILVASLRTNLTERQLAAVFRVAKTTIHRIIATCLPIIAAFLPKVARPDARFLYLVDGTLLPAPRSVLVGIVTTPIPSKSRSWCGNETV